MYEFSEKIKRLAKLAKNPENRKCPACNASINIRKNGDMFCNRFNLDYEKQAGCFWHRYENGLNYWSEIEEVMRAMSKEHGITLP